MLLVVADADEVTGLARGIPGDVEPAVAGKELVGERMVAQEVDEMLELGRILGADIGCLTSFVLRVGDAAHLAVYRLVAEAGADEDGTTYGLPCGLQQVAAAIGHVIHVLAGGDVVRVLAQFQEFAQLKMCGELHVIDCVFH